MSDSTIEQILKLASQRADAAEVYYLSSQDTPIEFENNRLKSLQTKAPSREKEVRNGLCNGFNGCNGWWKKFLVI